MLFDLASALTLVFGTGPVRAAPPAACITMETEELPLPTRKSPLDSLTFAAAGGTVKVCYGRPSLRGRTMLGSKHVPYGKVWRTGANEPTMLHTSVPLMIAGIAVPAGRYSLYTVPAAREWQVIVNRSTSQWGEESGYPKVQNQEIARGTVQSERLAAPVEMFTIRAEPASGGATALVLEWERTRVRIPIAAGATR